MRRLFILLFLIGAPVVWAQDSLLVVVRVDDVQSRSPIVPRSLVPFEQAVEARGGKVSWVVIPHRLIEPQHSDGTLAAELRASVQRGHEIVLHGYTHICPRCNQSSHEMWCLRDQVSHPRSVQAGLLDDAFSTLSAQLADPAVKSFVPPGHYGDRTTFALLADRGITTLSLPTHYEDSLAAGQFNLRTSEDFAWDLSAATYASRRTAALEDVRTRGREQGYYVLLLHDPFTRPGFRDNLVANWTGEVLDSISVMMEGRVAFVTLAEAAARLQRENTAVAPIPELPPPMLFPNPARGSSRVRLPAPTPATLTVIDLLGRVVQQHRLPGGDTATLDAQRLVPGLYFVHVEQGGTLTILRWTVLR